MKTLDQLNGHWMGLRLTAVEAKLFIPTAVAAVFASLLFAPAPIGVLGAVLGIVAVAIATVDYYRFIIPDTLNVAGFGGGLVHAAIQHPDAMWWAVGGAVVRGAALAFLFLSIRQFYILIRGRQGLGLGDVKLAGVAGAWLEWLAIPIAIEIAALVALSAYVFRQYWTGDSFSATHRLPFGFFFAPAIWICWVLQAVWMSS